MIYHNSRYEAHLKWASVSAEGDVVMEPKVVAPDFENLLKMLSTGTETGVYGLASLAQYSSCGTAYGELMPSKQKALIAEHVNQVVWDRKRPWI